jgi:hypothetical protein
VTILKGNFGGHPFAKNGELIERLGDIIDEYVGQISLAEVIGILDILKDELLESARLMK